jgi:hypothetical protein
MPGLVEDENGVELAGGGRAVEQQELPQLGRHSLDLGASYTVDDGLQGQIETLDVEENVELERRDEARRGIARAVPRAAVGVDEECGADRGKAHRESEQGRDRASGGAAWREFAVLVVQSRWLHFRTPVSGAYIAAFGLTSVKVRRQRAQVS